jgi:hypothetical protein
MSNQQKEIQRLTQALQQTMQEKQLALTDLQNTSLDLQSCRQTVEQSNQIITRLTDENGSLKEQNNLLAAAVRSSSEMASTPQPRAQIVESTAFSLIAFIVVGFGSMVIMAESAETPSRRHAAKAEAETPDVRKTQIIQRRRNATGPIPTLDPDHECKDRPLKQTDRSEPMILLCPRVGRGCCYLCCDISCPPCHSVTSHRRPCP